MISSADRASGQPGVRVGRGHLGEPGPQRPDPVPVVVEGPVGLGPEGVLEQREDVDGQVESPLLLGVGGAPPVVPEHGGPEGPGRLHRPGQQRPLGVPAGGGLGVDAVGADQHRHVQLAPADGQGGGVDQALGVVPPGGGHHQLGRLEAQRHGDQQPGVLVVPAQGIGHPQRLDAAQQPATGGSGPARGGPVAVLDGGPHGVDHEARWARAGRPGIRRPRHRGGW